jgi:hypothetical protein
MVNRSVAKSYFNNQPINESCVHEFKIYVNLTKEKIMALEKRYNDQDNKQQGDASASNSANAMKSNQQEQVSSYLTFEGAGFGFDLAIAANAIGQK